MTYDETIAYLVGLEATRGWDLKLERVRAALLRLGSPERAYPSILIAGTNGKGSTAAMVHAALLAGGRKVGLYTSPHLVSFTERIRVGNAEIGRDAIVRGVDEIRSRVDVEESGLTYFEVTTLLALTELARARVDAAVLEVGLGGRLDATNVVDPVASAVTSIGFDHEDYLGSTLDAIAREKAGVMRAGRPTVLGSAMPPEAHAALLDEARRSGAIVVEAQGSGAIVVEAADAAANVVAERTECADALALGGEHMRRNAAVACGLLEVVGAVEPRLRVDATAVARGLRDVRWPGRLALVHQHPRVVLDGAHNVEGALALRAALPALVGSGPVRLLFSALRDKHWREIASLLEPLASEIVVSEIGGKRGLAASELASAFARRDVRLEPDPARALRAMIAADRTTPILVTGSLFLVGMIYADLMATSRTRSVFDYAPGAGA